MASERRWEAIVHTPTSPSPGFVLPAPGGQCSGDGSKNTIFIIIILNRYVYGYFFFHAQGLGKDELGGLRALKGSPRAEGLQMGPEVKCGALVSDMADFWPGSESASSNPSSGPRWPGGGGRRELFSTLCLSFLVGKVEITVAPASGVLAKTRFNASL